MDTAAAAAAQAYGENATSGVGQSAVDKICRLCCAEGQAELSLLFPEGSSYEANKLLLKKIYECTTVQIINEGDDQNAMICEACIAKIDDFYSYREQCRANDDRIRQRAGHHVLPEIHIKQEKDLQLEINIAEPQTLTAACEDGFQQQEDSSHPRPTTTSNEYDMWLGLAGSIEGEDETFSPCCCCCCLPACLKLGCVELRALRSSTT
ncbi:AAEL003795-PA [Aedes aegypti]|uniref:AAEL003795-PA n=1 Tax=Aedes aegypti TaxID=7159 RepID=Q17EK8_AEDAE|nr:AAEL003795-PA [Aedes aegypti]